MSISACVHLEDDTRIECVTQHTDSKPEGYPVLRIGTVAIFPSLAQLDRIREAAELWLEADAYRAEVEAEASAPAAIC
jgi:hypothetical protein